MPAVTVPRFYRGAKPRARGEFRDYNGTLVDPDDVFAFWRDPSGNVDQSHYDDDPEIQREDVGIYYIDIDGDEAGVWSVALTCVGTYQGAIEGDFEIIERNAIV